MEGRKKGLHRREALMLGSAAAVAAMAPRQALAAGEKPLRGAMPIVLTPFTPSNQVDYQDLAGQMVFYDRVGVTGAVWPQGSSDVGLLSKVERMKGMKVVADACRPTKVASIIGVQGATKDEMLEYARYAVTLNPDALIAMPPSAEQSQDAYHAYFSALAKLAKCRVVFQTSIPGMKNPLVPSIDLIVDLAKEFPNMGYVKEESDPLVPRMKAELQHRDVMHGIYGASGGDGWLYELRLGMDGDMTGEGMYGDVMAAIFNLYKAGKREQSADAFSKLLLMKNCEFKIPGTARYIFKKRGVFKSTASRRGAPKGQVIVPELSPDAIAEIEFRYATLKPYLVPGV